MPLDLVAPGSLGGGIMADGRDVLKAAVSLLVKAALLAARFSGRVRERSLKRLVTMDIHAIGKTSGEGNP